MAWNKVIWSGKCLGFCLLGTFLCGRVTAWVNPLLWCALHRAEATYLSRSIFQFQYFFQLRALYGCLLGLIPIRVCIEALRSMGGMFRTHEPMEGHSEVDWRRPILWAWAPLAVIFLWRFVTWRAPDASVLAAPDHFERLRYFFSPMSFASLNPLAPQAPGLVFDLVLITGPMVFLLAYSAGVWLRHQRPGLEDTVEPALIEPAEQPTDLH